MPIEPLRGSDVISVRDLADMRSAGGRHTVLDVREARELDVCRPEGALHVPMAEIAAQTDNLPTDQLLVVICHHGARSQMIVDFLRSAGFDNAVNLDGASMCGLAMLTNQCRAIVSVRAKEKLRPSR
jgi:rhodanese-related sulfurtransferase